MGFIINHCAATKCSVDHAAINGVMTHGNHRYPNVSVIVDGQVKFLTPHGRIDLPENNSWVNYYLTQYEV